MTPVLTKSFKTEAAIEGHLIVAAGDGGVVIAATSARMPLIGAAGSMGAPAYGMLDVVLVGRDEVRAGGDISFGDPLTSDANGKAIKAVPVAGSVIRVVGFAQTDASDGDIFPYLVAPSVIATPA